MGHSAWIYNIGAMGKWRLYEFIEEKRKKGLFSFEKNLILYFLFKKKYKEWNYFPANILYSFKIAENWMYDLCLYLHCGLCQQQ